MTGVSVTCLLCSCLHVRKNKMIWISLFSVINHGLYLLKKRISLVSLERMWLLERDKVFPSNDGRPQISTSHQKAERTFNTLMVSCQTGFYFSSFLKFEKLVDQKKLGSGHRG